MIEVFSGSPDPCGRPEVTANVRRDQVVAGSVGAASVGSCADIVARLAAQVPSRTMHAEGKRTGYQIEGRLVHGVHAAPTSAVAQTIPHRFREFGQMQPSSAGSRTIQWVLGRVFVVLGCMFGNHSAEVDKHTTPTFRVERGLCSAMRTTRIEIDEVPANFYEPEAAGALLLFGHGGSHLVLLQTFSVGTPATNFSSSPSIRHRRSSIAAMRSSAAGDAELPICASQHSAS
jgi:hypothetical protein